MTDSAKGTPRLFVFVVFCLVASIAGWSQNDVAVEPLVGANISEGGIIYKVTSQSPRTVEVTSAQSSYSGDIVIPSTMTWYSGGTWQYTVTAIGNQAFRNCTSLTSVSIPSTVTKIGSSAFSGCEVLQSASLGENVATIGEYAFSGCTSLESVTGMAAVDSIGQGAFQNCKALGSITIPASTRVLGYLAFYSSSIKSLTIADGGTPLSLIYNYSGGSGSPFYYCTIDTLYLGRNIRTVNRSTIIQTPTSPSILL